jgi:hypothetical protein
MHGLRWGARSRNTTAPQYLIACVACTMSSRLNDDFMDMLEACILEQVEFLVVGAYAMAMHGVPRATGDIDLWIRPSPENAERVWRALVRFGAPVRALNFTPVELATRGLVFQLGLPPRRIDLTTAIDGVEFDEAWSARSVADIDGLQVPYLDRRSLVANKRAAGRPKDLGDIALLEGDDEQA